MKSAEIREVFIRFFEDRGHRVVSSSSLVPNDPTLLLTNAGMVQFKPYFLGEEVPQFTRATSVQKCLRTTDIDSVGITARHCTFFEMLGNFSFGDYYKEEVIPWAWELVTRVYDIEPDSLWMSVYEEDDEAEGIWKATSGVRPERVIRLGADDNFWDMGSTGPCGPCSEILYDRGEQFACGPECRAGCDCDRFLELWNLVFMQYERQPDQTLVPLPRKNIDTGMGLERVAALKQGVPTIFETDVVKPIVEAIGSLSGVKLGEGAASDVSIKVVADHSRAATLMISDGVIPSNEGKGYILRRLLRRAVRHGRLLGIERHFINGLSDVVVELLGDVYPDLKEHHKLVAGVIKSEEERFGQTLEQGIELLREVIADHKSESKETIDGKTVFYLHDTLGFPLEVTAEIAADEGMDIDREGFERLMEEQRERARTSREYETQTETDIFADACRELGPSCFEGYESSSLASPVAALFVGVEGVTEASDSNEVEVVLERTPFYAESGGQVGDTGTIKTSDATIEVEDAYYGAPGFIVHRGRLTGRVKVGDEALATVDTERRAAISRNHSATHLLHWALRTVLGTHAKQSGSLVTPERLRFDFTHFQAVTPEELEEIEALANARVLEDVPVSTLVTSKEEAMAAGAMALFGEKYGEQVRMVEMGDFSRELCGGIHIDRSGRIGPIRVIGESGIGAGLRRIEATSGFETLRHYKHVESVLVKTETLLKVRGDLVPDRVEDILARMKELERAQARERSSDMATMAKEISNKARVVRVEKVGGFNVLTDRLDGIDPRGLRDLADMLMNEGDYGVVGLAGDVGGKAQLVVKVEKALVESGVDAREIARAVGKHLGGGGGGRPDMGMSGGGLTDSINMALADIPDVLMSLLEGSS